MFEEAKNSKKQGDIGLGIAIGWFSSQGLTVCVPLTDSQDYDLVAEFGDSLQRIQIKTTSQRAPSGFFKVALRVCGGNRSGTGKVKMFDTKASDQLFVLTNDGRKFLIPTSIIESKNELILSGKYLQYEIK